MSFSGGAQCWPTVVQAAQAQCVSVGGVMAGASVSCDGVVSVGESSAVLKYRFVDAAGSVTLADVPYASAPCEYPTFDGFWGPVIGVAVVALITVRSISAFRGMFKRESL